MESLVTQLETLTVGLQTVLQNRDLGGGKPSPVGPRYHNHNTEHGEVHLKSIKLDFPKFDGEDPFGWLYRANQFFAFNQTQPYHRILIASFHMERKALIWFLEVEQSGTITNLDAFVKAMLLRFGPNTYDDPMKSLIKFRQTITLEKY